MSRILPQIEHVVVLMLENRSFDNVVGWAYSGSERPQRLVHGPTNGDPPTYDGLGNGIEYANELKGKRYPVRRSALDFRAPHPDPSEEYAHVTKQIFDREEEPAEGTPATMGGFLRDYFGHGVVNDPRGAADQIMVTYTPEQLPVLNGLARRYAISDRWFSSVPSQTNPNRAYLACGTSHGAESNTFNQTFEDRTIWNVLEDHGISDWGIFYHRNTLPYYLGKCYTQYTFRALDGIPYVDEHICDMETFYRKARGGSLPAFSFLEPSWVAISGGNGNDYHPPGNLRPGEKFVHDVYESLSSNPDAWSRTLLVLTFDEHGGTWDHVPPPWGATPPDDVTGPTGFRFDRFGVRVPTLLVSPWVEEGTVFRSEKTKGEGDDVEEIPYDHTSIIATILRWSVPEIDLAGCGLGRRVPVAPTFERVLGRTEPRGEAARLDAGPPSWDESAHLDSPLNGLHEQVYLPVLAANLVGADAGEEALRDVVDEILATCETQRDLDGYVSDHVGRRPGPEIAQNYRVKISVRNETRSRIWYWLAYGSKKIPVGNPLGHGVETGDTVEAFAHVDAMSHRYYLAAAYWVGDRSKIPKEYRIVQKPGWRLIGAPSPGWMEIGRRQTLVVGEPTATEAVQDAAGPDAPVLRFGHDVDIKVRNQTPARLTYWLSYDAAKVPVTSPAGAVVEAGETVTALGHSDLLDHQYYLAVAYWVGAKSKIPEKYRCWTPGWRLVGAPYPGWMKVAHHQTYTLTRPGPPRARVEGPLGVCE